MRRWGKGLPYAVVLLLGLGVPAGAQDGASIRKAAIKYKLPYITTTAAARAGVAGIAAARTGKAGVKSLQSYHHDIGG